jgi:hypothetical protein
MSLDQVDASQNHPETQWCRYADDGLVHCKTQKQALNMLNRLTQRFNNCGLELHALIKRRWSMAQDSNRKSKHPITYFDFLGYTFKPRLVRSSDSKMFVSFTPAVSSSASKAMKDRIRQWKLKYRVELSLEEIAVYCNPVLRGWMQYYGSNIHHQALSQFGPNLMLYWLNGACESTRKSMEKQGQRRCWSQFNKSSRHCFLIGE